MAYIGNTNTTQGFTPAVDYFNGDGSTVAFTLSRPVASVAQVQAVIENVPQNPGTAFTVSGNTITFDSAPPSGTSNIYVYYTSPITQVIQPGQGTVGTAQLAPLTTLPVSGGATLTLPTTSGTVALNTGYQFVQRVYFTSSGTFTKASYPWLRAVRVMCVGGGGGGGGVAATGAGEFSTGAGGGGGGYADSFITNISGLASSVTVTVGNGGAGASAGANTGSIGGNSSFGSAVIGVGGAGGQGQAAFTFWITTSGGGGGGGTGDLVVIGGSGTSGNPVNTNGGYGGTGGSTVLGQSATPALAWQSGGAGTNGNLYGTGGSGAANGASRVAQGGGNGAAGIVILELFA
jgi:hypothetical protein